MSSPAPGPLPVLGPQGEAGHQDVGDEGHGCRKQTDTRQRTEAPMAPGTQTPVPDVPREVVGGDNLECKGLER